MSLAFRFPFSLPSFLFLFSCTLRVASHALFSLRRAYAASTCSYARFASLRHSFYRSSLVPWPRFGLVSASTRSRFVPFVRWAFLHFRDPYLVAAVALRQRRRSAVASPQVSRISPCAQRTASVTDLVMGLYHPISLVRARAPLGLSQR